MIYFVNQYLMALNSGVEHAELKRLQLFADQHVPAQLVTRHFDGLLHQNMRRFQLTDQQMVNLFDFFRGTQTYPAKVLKIEALNFPRDYTIKPNPNVSAVTDGDRLVAKVHFVPSTVGHVYFVEYFDTFGNLVQRTDYDERGFKARDEFMAPTGEVITAIFYYPDGTRLAEQYYEHNADGVNVVTLCQLLNYHGQNYYFNSEDEWYRFFLDELNQQQGGHNTFIADRPLATQRPVIEMQTPAKKYLWLPTPHAIDPHDQVYSNLNNAYVYGIHEHLVQLDGLITSTEQQRQDLTEWLGGKAPRPIYAISQAVVPAAQAQRPAIRLADRHAHQLIYTGRVDQGRRVDQVVTALQQVRQTVADATLVIYGYGGALNQLKDQVERLQLKQAVTFAGYQPDLTAAYDRAGAYVYTGESDAQPLSLVEALSHGVPAIAYNINYGPRDVIQDNVNGYLVADGDINQLAQAIIKTLTKPKHHQHLIDGAYQSSQQYSEATVWQQWQALLGN